MAEVNIEDADAVVIACAVEYMISQTQAASSIVGELVRELVVDGLVALVSEGWQLVPPDEAVVRAGRVAGSGQMTDHAPLTNGCECFHCDRARKGLTPTGDAGRGQTHTPVVRHPPLTDEELALGVAHCGYCSMRPKPDPGKPIEWGRERCAVGGCVQVVRREDADRLIADLRASRAELENATQAERCQWLAANTLRIRNEELEAGVERLRAALAPFVKAGMVEDVNRG